MDVKTTFLNGDLKEEVYIKQTKGFVKSRFEHLVYILNKVFNELHQSPWIQYEKIDLIFLKYTWFSNEKTTNFIS
jgi:hypothetical protein